MVVRTVLSNRAGPCLHCENVTVPRATTILIMRRRFPRNASCESSRLQLSRSNRSSLALAMTLLSPRSFQSSLNRSRQRSQWRLALLKHQHSRRRVVLVLAVAASIASSFIPRPRTSMSSSPHNSISFVVSSSVHTAISLHVDVNALARLPHERPDTPSQHGSSTVPVYTGA